MQVMSSKLSPVLRALDVTLETLAENIWNEGGEGSVRLILKALEHCK